MKVNRNFLLNVSLTIGLILILLGAFFKISHLQGADVLMIIGFVAILIYTLNINATMYYLVQWFTWAFAAILFIGTDRPIKNMIIKIIILGLLATYLVWIGIRDFKTKSKTS